MGNRVWILLSLAACTPAATPADAAAYGVEQKECVDRYADKPSIDACRAESKARTCARFPDLTICSDAGGAS